MFSTYYSPESLMWCTISLVQNFPINIQRCRRFAFDLACNSYADTVWDIKNTFILVPAHAESRLCYWRGAKIVQRGGGQKAWFSYTYLMHGSLHIFLGYTTEGKYIFLHKTDSDFCTTARDLLKSEKTGKNIRVLMPYIKIVSIIVSERYHD